MKYRACALGLLLASVAVAWGPRASSASLDGRFSPLRDVPLSAAVETSDRSSRGSDRGDASLDLTVRLLYGKTWWFQVLLVGLALGSVSGGVYFFVRRQRSARRRLEREVRERTRELAREHETVAAQARELARLDDLKSGLIASLSHELRTPLTLVLGPLRDLETGAHGPLGPEVAARVALARNGAEEVLARVEALLDLARFPGRQEEGSTEPERQGSAPEPAPLEPARFEDLLDDRTTVLVVDDNSAILAYLRGILEPHYRVLEAADGAEGLRVARGELPDLVVTDLMMPEMDGLELTRRLKADPELDYVPVVLLTAKGSSESKLAGLGEGADDYLTKPFDAPELLARIDNLIRQRQRLRERFAAGPGAPPAVPVSSGTRLSASDRAFLERVRGALEEGVGDEGFRVESLAASLAIDRSQLFRRLKELTGSTPSEFLLETRLRRAAELLRSGEGSIGEVAVAVGFKSVAHFSQRFRRRFGATPSAWRRSRARDPQVA